MELGFEKTGLACMQTLLDTHTETEQTLEVKLADGLADVGCILGAWGQVLIRSKEWGASSVGVSGGVLAWVMYMPEEGQTPVCVQGWLPFQARWDIPATPRDGNICLHSHIRSVDARCVSARKLMLRAVVELDIAAYVAQECALYTPGQLPEEICLQKSTYPMTLCTEVGEKTFSMDEHLELPANIPALQKILCQRIQPELIDHKVIGGRLVFRGVLLIGGMGMDEQGGLWPLSLEVPFSQYTELEREYPEAADAWVEPVLTGLELDPEEGGVRLKAGLMGQYRLYDTTGICLVTDAYSTQHTLAMTTENLELPYILEQGQQRFQAQAEWPEDCREVVDAVFLSEPVRSEAVEDGVKVCLSGRFQVLYRKNDGSFACAWQRWEEDLHLSAEENVAFDFAVIPSGRCQWAQGGLRQDLRLSWNCRGREGLQMLTGVTLEQTPLWTGEKPGLLLRRPGNMSLWELAKATGSTVEAITKANGLVDEPVDDRFLLIPVM